MSRWFSPQSTMEKKCVTDQDCLDLGLNYHFCGIMEYKTSTSQIDTSRSSNREIQMCINNEHKYTYDWQGRGGEYRGT